MIRIPDLHQNKNTEPDNETNVYYNVRIDENNSNQKGSNGVPIASFKENRVEPILEDPSEYVLAIERFKVPAFDIPILLWEDNKYDVTLKFGATSITKILQFIPNSNVPDLYGDSIWNYQELLDSLNQALEDAYTDLKLAEPLAPPTEAPFVTYEASSQLFIFNAEQLYDVNGPPTIEVEFNADLAGLFSFRFFNQVQPYPSQFKIIIKNNYNNSTTINGKPYYSTYQQFITLSLWNSLASIVFETDTIPVSQELQPGQTNITRRIVTDFEPLESPNNREAFQFYPQGPLRYYDLESKYPLTSIDIRVSWLDRTGKSYPIYISSDNIVTVKILFRKRAEIIREINEREHSSE